MTPADITRARKALGLTQEELAIRAGVSTQSVNRLERGVTLRPDTVKAVCAALDIAYTPMNHIEVVGPEAHVAHPSTGQFLAMAETLPGVRYLVRIDDREWSRFMRGMAGWWPWLCRVSEEVGRIPSLLFMFVATTLCMAGVSSIMVSATYWQAKLQGGSPHPVAFLALCFCMWAGLVLLIVPIGYIRRYRSPGDHLDEAYAISEVAVWQMCLKEGRILCWRTEMREGKVKIVTAGQEALLILPPRGRGPVSELVPAVPGLVSLVERANDDFRVGPALQLSSA